MSKRMPIWGTARRRDRFGHGLVDFTFTMSQESMDALNDIAIADDKSVSQVLREAVKAYIQANGGKVGWQ